MNLISVNINGLNDHVKRTALVDWLKCMKADVVCLQETHTPSHESARKWFANSGYRVASSSFTSKSAGVAILVRDTWKISKIIKDDHGHFIQVFVDFGENQLSFVSLYAMNTNPERNRYLTSLTDLIDLSRPVFIGGDFNSVLHPEVDRMRDPFHAPNRFAHRRECCCIGVAHVLHTNIRAMASLTSRTHSIFVDARIGWSCVANRHGVGSNSYG